MKDRICRLFLFFNCTTAPTTALPLGSVTMPFTERTLSDWPFLLDWARAKFKNRSESESRRTPKRPIDLPITVGCIPHSSVDRDGAGQDQVSLLFPIVFLFFLVLIVVCQGGLVFVLFELFS